MTAWESYLKKYITILHLQQALPVPQNCADESSQMVNITSACIKFNNGCKNKRPTRSPDKFVVPFRETEWW